MKKEKPLAEYATDIKDAKKRIQEAKKVMDVRIKAFSDETQAKQLLESKYGKEEAKRLIDLYWNFNSKD